MLGIEVNSKHEVEDIINTFDRVGDGHVDFPTFVHLIKTKMVSFK